MNLKDKVITEIKKIYDPEIPVNIYELGLIYDIEVNNTEIKVKMTLTTPNCPVAESLPKEVKDSIMEIKEVSKVCFMPLALGGGIKDLEDIKKNFCSVFNYMISPTDENLFLFDRY